MVPLKLSLGIFAPLCLLAASAQATPFSFSTGLPDGALATSSRPSSPGVETETADDFALTETTTINHATFTGLLTGNVTLSDINHVGVELYRVFPLDSTVPPSSNVPTRLNSPSDVAFDDRGTDTADLAFALTLLNPSFTASNSVLNGINLLPNVTTLGEGAVTGLEVQFDVTFLTPFVLPPDHYFFVPQVGLNGGGEFMWLSAPRPIPGDPLLPDLQTWIRNGNLAPDWLRLTDILGPTSTQGHNASFSLNGFTGNGQVVPEPSTVWLLLGGLCIAALFARCNPIQLLSK